MPKPTFFYATGTSYLLSIIPQALGLGGAIGDFPGITIPGYNGRNGYLKGPIANDPMPSMLDPYKWNAVKINYPAATFPMLPSIGAGVGFTVRAINALPKGTPFALGGTSQGAGVMSLVLKNHLQTNNGTPFTGFLPDIRSRYADLKAGVMFGNPARQTGKTWAAFKSYPGGIRCASNSNPNATGVTQSCGAFPAEYRLTNTPSYWYEFTGSREDAIEGAIANNPMDEITKATLRGFGGDSRVDIVTCIDPNSTNGALFIEAAGIFLSNNAVGLALDLAATVLLLGGHTGSETKINALQAIGAFGNAGHVMYVAAPPNGYPPTAPTSLQIALEYLDMIADQQLKASSMIPSVKTGSSAFPRPPITNISSTTGLPPRNTNTRGFAPAGFRPTTRSRPLPRPNTGGRGFR